MASSRSASSLSGNPDKSTLEFPGKREEKKKVKVGFGNVNINFITIITTEMNLTIGDKLVLCTDENYREVCGPFHGCYAIEEVSNKKGCACYSFYGFEGSDCRSHSSSVAVTMVIFAYILPLMVALYGFYGTTSTFVELRRCGAFQWNVVGCCLISSLLTTFGLVGLITCNFLGFLAPYYDDEEEIAAYDIFSYFSIITIFSAPIAYFSISLTWIRVARSSKKLRGKSTNFKAVETAIFGVETLSLGLFIFFIFMGWFTLMTVYNFLLALLINVAFFIGSRKLVSLMTLTNDTTSAQSEIDGSKKITQSYMIMWISNRINIFTLLNTICGIVYVGYVGQNESGSPVRLSGTFNGFYLGSIAATFASMLRYLRFSYRKHLKNRRSSLVDIKSSKIAATSFTTSTSTVVNENIQSQEDDQQPVSADDPEK